MKLHLLSDLHLGVRPLAPAPVRGDVLILAGDISDGDKQLAFDFAANYVSAGLPVLYVPGNHEYDYHGIARELRDLSLACRRHGITLLHNRVVTLGGVRFAGGTLWTDFALNGTNAGLLPLTLTLQHLNRVTDYQRIWHGDQLLTPERTQRYHAKTLAFLERVFAQPFDGPTVMITHHGVHPRSVHPRFERSPSNPAFVSDLTRCIERWQPTLIVHGHVHDKFDYWLGDTRVVTNPRGYYRKAASNAGVVEVPEHDAFDPDFVLEI